MNPSISSHQGSPHVQASISARYAKIFGRYAAEPADTHCFSCDTHLFLIPLLFVAKTVWSWSWSWYSFSGPGKPKLQSNFHLQAHTEHALFTCQHVYHYTAHALEFTLPKKTWMRHECRQAILLIAYRHHIYTMIHLERRFFSKDGHQWNHSETTVKH